MADNVTLNSMSGGATAAPADMWGKAVTDGYGPAPIVYAGHYTNTNYPAHMEYSDKVYDAVEVSVLREPFGDKEDG